MGHDAMLLPLRKVTGLPLAQVRRIHYTVNGTPDTDFGPMELTIGDRVFLIDNASDGEALRILTEAWHDPFAEPLSAVNREFVARSGKWCAYDVSGECEFSSLMGELLESVDPIFNSAGKITGLVLRTSRGGLVRLEVAADELYLTDIRAAGANERLA